jgi:hypothetical protein
MVTVIRPSRARCVEGRIARRRRAVFTFKEGRMCFYLCRRLRVQKRQAQAAQATSSWALACCGWLTVSLAAAPTRRSSAFVLADKDSRLANYTSYDWIMSNPLDEQAAAESAAAAAERERAEALGAARAAAHAAGRADRTHTIDVSASPSVGPPPPRAWRSPYWQ